MAAARSWGNVFDNILVTISGFLPCRADRVHMACVNKHWRAAVTLPPPPPLPPLPDLPPQLPWIIFPRAEPEAPIFYSPLTASYHRLCRLPDDVRCARWCGSGDGGWLVLAFDAPPAHALYNLNTGRRIPLPLGITFPNVNNDVFPLVLQSATLSASPSGGPRYMVAAIALVNERPTAAFWFESFQNWFSMGGLLPVMPQDVIYHAGTFFFVTPGEDLIRFGGTRGPNGEVTVGRLSFDTRRRVDYDEDVGSMLVAGTMKRYLVNSRGRLLMVVRYVYNVAGTGMLRVFQLSTSAPGINGDHTWEHIVELSGRMMFLGPGCSRSFEVAHYDGFSESMIYFLDESLRLFAVPSVDDDDTETGRYTMGQMNAVSWPPGRPSRSHASPTLWLH